MRKKNVDRKYLILAVIAIIMIILGILSYVLKKKDNLNGMEIVIKDTITSIENIISYPFKLITGRGNDKKNDVTKASLDKLDSLEVENIELRKQLESMKKELDIDYIISDYDYVNASVISRNISYWYNTITINKGSNDGIKEFMPVVNASGLVGKVIYLSKKTATIRLITTNDSNSKISVIIKSDNNSVNGIMTNFDYKKNILEVEGIGNTKSVRIGDYVYTSGLGGIFPSGILIGKVEAITKDEYDLSKIINVKPVVDFDNINYVAVLKRKSDDK